MVGDAFQTHLKLLTAIAEDYYANDYPEDELESDDEYGRQAYGYRVGASDDEEFDEEYDSCSEDELEKETSLGRATTDR